MTDIESKVERFFSPCLTLYWRGRFGRSPAAWFPDKTADRALLTQLKVEAGLRKTPGSRCLTEELDAVMAEAGKHGYSIETIGDDFREAEEAGSHARPCYA